MLGEDLDAQKLLHPLLKSTPFGLCYIRQLAFVCHSLRRTLITDESRNQNYSVNLKKMSSQFEHIFENSSVSNAGSEDDPLDTEPTEESPTASPVGRLVQVSRMNRHIRPKPEASKANHEVSMAKHFDEMCRSHNLDTRVRFFRNVVPDEQLNVVKYQNLNYEKVTFLHLELFGEWLAEHALVLPTKPVSEEELLIMRLDGRRKHLGLGSAQNYFSSFKVNVEQKSVAAARRRDPTTNYKHQFKSDETASLKIRGDMEKHIKKRCKRENIPVKKPHTTLSSSDLRAMLLLCLWSGENMLREFGLFLLLGFMMGGRGSETPTCTHSEIRMHCPAEWEGLSAGAESKEKIPVINLFRSKGGGNKDPHSLMNACKTILEDVLFFIFLKIATQSVGTDSFFPYFSSKLPGREEVEDEFLTSNMPAPSFYPTAASSEQSAASSEGASASSNNPIDLIAEAVQRVAAESGANPSSKFITCTLLAYTWHVII